MPSEQLVEQMQYFVGKMCTILTPPMAMPLDKHTHPDWFTVMVDGIDHEAIVGTDALRGTKHLFFFPVMGIIEEQMVKPDHPHYEDIKRQVEEQRTEQQTTKADPPTQKFVQIEDLQQVASELKQKWSTSSSEKEPHQEKT